MNEPYLKRIHADKKPGKLDVYEIAEVIELVQHLLAPGGVIAAMKGLHPFEEIERIPPGYRVRQVHALSVPGLDAKRHLVLIERA